MRPVGWTSFLQIKQNAPLNVNKYELNETERFQIKNWTILGVCDWTEPTCLL